MGKMKNRAIEISNMPKYRSKDEINAVKILDTDKTVDGGMIIVPEERFEPFTVSRELVETYNPKTGGYYIVRSGSEMYLSEELFNKQYCPVDFEDNKVEIEYTRYFILAYMGADKNGNLVTGNTTVTTKGKNPFLNERKMTEELLSKGRNLKGDITFTMIKEVSKEEFETWNKE